MLQLPLYLIFLLILPPSPPPPLRRRRRPPPLLLLLLRLRLLLLLLLLLIRHYHTTYTYFNDPFWNHVPLLTPCSSPAIPEKTITNTLSLKRYPHDRYTSFKLLRPVSQRRGGGIISSSGTCRYKARFGLHLTLHELAPIASRCVHFPSALGGMKYWFLHFWI